MRELELREIEWLTQGHSDELWHWPWNPGLSGSKAQDYLSQCQTRLSTASCSSSVLRDREIWPAHGAPVFISMTRPCGQHNPRGRKPASARVWMRAASQELSTSHPSICLTSHNLTVTLTAHPQDQGRREDAGILCMLLCWPCSERWSRNT